MPSTDFPSQDFRYGIRTQVNRGVHCAFGLSGNINLAQLSKHTCDIFPTKEKDEEKKPQ